MLSYLSLRYLGTVIEFAAFAAVSVQSMFGHTLVEAVPARVQAVRTDLS